MNLSSHTAQQIREAFFGKNWTASSFKDHLGDVSWEQATTKIPSFNTIAALVYHVNYYMEAILMVFREGKLNASDRESFNHPPITSKEEWEAMVARMYENVEAFAGEVEKLTNEQMAEDFWENKFGSLFRNIHGIVEHSHYHLGQIVFLKKMLAANNN
ncbi:MAG: DinB family protein [Bacteroidota bacterium]